MKRILLITLLVMLPSSIVLAQDFCRGDFNYNGSVAADDVTTFLEHFGRSLYNNPCPPDGPTPVQKTGQSTSYATGDDGDLERGVSLAAPRFRDNGDETVTDRLTGLTWHRNANLFGEVNWLQALNAIATLNTGAAYGDWRLPNVRELQTLIDYSQREPALPSENPFVNILGGSRFFWSATTKMGVEPSPFNEAYGVDLGDGTVAGYSKIEYTLSVWPVRGGH